MIRALVASNLHFEPSAITRTRLRAPRCRFDVGIAQSCGTLLKSAGLDVLRDSLLGLTLLGAVIFGFGVRRFRRQFG